MRPPCDGFAFTKSSRPVVVRVSFYLFAACAVAWFVLAIWLGPLWSLGVVVAFVVARWFYRRVVQMSDADRTD